MEYLNKVLGIEVVYMNGKFEHLPNFIATRYRLREPLVFPLFERT